MQTTKKISHIAFADDDSDDHFLFFTALTSLSSHIRLTEFYHGDDLIEWLSSPGLKLPDLILIDYKMPGNDDNKVLRTIKETPQLAELPAVIYSTSRDAEIIEESLKLGAFKYLVKPDSVSDIKKAILQLCRECEASPNQPAAV